MGGSSGDSHWAVAAGLIGATGLKLVGALKSNVMGQLVCWGLAGVTFVAIALLRIPLAWVLFGVGSLACGNFSRSTPPVAARRLGC